MCTYIRKQVRIKQTLQLGRQLLPYARSSVDTAREHEKAAKHCRRYCASAIPLRCLLVEEVCCLCEGAWGEFGPSSDVSSRSRRRRCRRPITLAAFRARKAFRARIQVSEPGAGQLLSERPSLEKNMKNQQVSAFRALKRTKITCFETRKAFRVLFSAKRTTLIRTEYAKEYRTHCEIVR